MISFKTLRALCIDFVIFFIPLYLLRSAIPYIFAVALPFLVGYILFLAANPLNKLLKKALPPSLCATLSLFIISFVVFFILRALFVNLYREIMAITQGGNAFSDVLPFISRKMSVADSGSDVFASFFKAFASSLSSLLIKLSSFLIGFAGNIPSFLIAVFASVFTAFFLLKDNSFLKKFLLDFFGENMVSRFSDLKNSVLDVAFSYLKAQFIIGSIVFAVLFCGFLYIGIKYSLLLAFFAAIVDAVPIFGTGFILIPLSVFYFVTGETSVGWGVLVLYGIAVLTRQLCEPKIIGQKLGMHPLLTLFSLYAGLKLLGIFGLISGPVIALFVKNIISSKRENVSA